MCWNVQARGIRAEPLYVINPQPCPHVCVFTWERNFLLTDTASVHTYPMKTIDENGTFRKRSPDWNFLKTPFSRVRVDRRKRNFSKTLRTHYQFQSTLRKNLLNMADERFSFLSFILGLISNIIACFQANLALLILHADYSRGRQNIIRLYIVCVWTGENAMSGREFFCKRRKKFAFSNKYG